MQLADLIMHVRRLARRKAEQRAAEKILADVERLLL